MVEALKDEILKVIEDRRNGVVEESANEYQYKPMLTLTSV